MAIERPWAFWRRVQYLSGFFVIMIAFSSYVYATQYYVAPDCFDGMQNGEERGVDCGGVCAKICLLDVTPPKVIWSRSFRVNDGQYNAVAYLENQNVGIGAPKISYTISLYDEEGLIISRDGTTVLPPDRVYPIFEGRLFTNNRVPIRTIVTINETEPWYRSTDEAQQFQIEERQLYGADTDPRLEVSLRNDALTEANDVEVVATIFDANKNALTSSRTFVDRFSPQSTTDIVFTWPEPIAKTIRSCEVPTDVLVAIDLSGSMDDDGENPPEPISSVLTAAAAFVDRLRAQDAAGVITFATESVIVQTLSADTSIAADVVRSLVIAPPPVSSFTNTGDAFVVAEAEFSSGRHNPNARKVMVLLTDGLATAPEEDPSGYALEKAQLLKENNVEVYTIGLGENVNTAFLATLASSPEQSFQALSRSQIDDIYTNITGSICEDGAAVIEVIPKTGSNFIEA